MVSKRDLVFLSYRRSDTEASVTALRQSLAKAFGDEAVFQDVTDIDAGDEWLEQLQSALARAAVVVVVIGNDWLTVTDEYGDRRLNQPGDAVALEVTSALADGAVTVIPLLVDGARMPGPDEMARLPQGLRALGSRSAYMLEHKTWDRDIGPLVEVVARKTGRAGLVLERLAMAGQFQDQGDYALAVDVLRRLIEREPDNVRALYELGVSQQKLLKNSAAGDTFERVLSIQPENLAARYNYGVVGLLRR